jgi:hypothetical protein
MRKMTHLLFKIPYIMPPRAARSASALLQTSKTLSNNLQMASSGVSDESESELQFADKDAESDRDSQRSKASYCCEPSSTFTNLKPLQPGKKKKKKKRSKLAEACQEIEVMCSTLVRSHHSVSHEYTVF